MKEQSKMYFNNFKLKKVYLFILYFIDINLVSNKIVIKINFIYINITFI